MAEYNLVNEFMEPITNHEPLTVCIAIL